ncbi:glycosyl transferase [Pukyongia salina]|uniref:Glycosyl transferase n=1 Tax=Pukyongia salina TaxID=2094025 RepID=A0A2S0HXN3_9FLAO|nr:glycosyltransferase [Pukyongia salina]AVI51447.1 glycosyl transferase [Pukyongia salina]
MTLAIISHTTHIRSSGRWFAYQPYVREMNLWTAHFEKVLITAPIDEKELPVIFSSYDHDNLFVRPVPAVAFNSVSQIFRALWFAPRIFSAVYTSMKMADHIHLRCPGNIGLIGCLVQILFPKKQKTAKYAGNWQPGARQPLSYRFQKWVLSNTFLTKNMKVLVYGEWPGQSQNIVPFFTASYTEEKLKMAVDISHEPPFRFVFVGTLSEGKQPLYALKLIEDLYRKGQKVQIDYFGDGPERANLENYIEEQALSEIATIHGAVKPQELEEFYRASHFLILPSRSEGWPKVVAEAMFWGLIPMASPVSCVPWMLDHGNRGVLLEMDKEMDVNNITTLLNDTTRQREMSSQSIKWSRQYTIDSFAEAIKKLIL